MQPEIRGNSLRELPAVHRVLSHPICQEAAAHWSPSLISLAASEVIDEIRTELLAGHVVSPWTLDSLADDVVETAKRKFQTHLRKVINATGIVLHTNLGRAPLATSALQAIQDSARGYSNLELNLDTGERGSRYSHVESLICKLTGADSALVVNNNAAAVFLILREMAKDQEVIVSRGQLVEIGGSFRVSEVMRESGARLIEVGTTNKTHLYDYDQAISAETALILRVHTSNFRMSGFTAQPTLRELVELSHGRGILVYEDLGSGSILDLRNYHVGDEPHVRESVEAGVDIVSFSGDKLLGGAQAGIIVGKEAFISRLKKNQLTRALRIDKLTLAALEATLLLYQDEQMALKEIPTLRMLTEDTATVHQRAISIANTLRLLMSEHAEIEVIETTAYVGGGSLPDEAIASYAVSIKSASFSVVQMEQCLRAQTVPVLAMIRKEALLLDTRTILEDEITTLVESIIESFRTCFSARRN